ncbi:MAG: sugar ABC transporter permease, partial [Oscillospiraceae bacterium]|nr:sugar ABC transporter permease [Oscillospiraceae bacterium]
MRRSKDRSIFIALCVAPATILFFIFMVLPTLNVFRMSLFERGAYSPTETFVGMNNFKVLFQDSKFIAAMQNTILLIVVVTVVTFFFALVFAGILTREKIKGQNFFRVIFYIPNILSVVVIAGIFSAIYKPENGMLNSILSFLSGREIMILWKDQQMVIISIIIAMVWQAIGYYMVMYMASMSAVPADLYESASLDGA